jgi:hypothetical protein
MSLIQIQFFIDLWGQLQSRAKTANVADNLGNLHSSEFFKRGG